MHGVIDNTERSRFELTESGQIAFANYQRRNSVLVIPHVESPPPLRGTGTAARLMEGVLAIVRARGEKVIPTCSYAAAYMRRHKEHHDLLAS
jgi:predicted GNAT family acetyltransferase